MARGPAGSELRSQELTWHAGLRALVSGANMARGPAGSELRSQELTWHAGLRALVSGARALK
jgi:hypothetical protein